MGSERGDNDGGRSPDGGDLPELPSGWGPLVIPDDVSALHHDSAWLRRQFRREARRNRWRRRLGRPPVYRRFRPGPPPMAAPMLVIMVAVMATLASLIAVAWPGRAVRPPGLTGQPPATPTLPDAVLRDATGHDLRLHDHLPAVLLLLTGCGCAGLVAATVAATGTGVTVIAVDQVVPALPTALPAGPTVLAATDPSGALGVFDGHSPGTGAGAAVVLIRGNGTIASWLTDVTSVETYRAALGRLS